MESNSSRLNQTIGDRECLRRRQLFEAAGAGSAAAGASWTGGGVCEGFGAACFLAAASVAPEAGRGDGEAAGRGDGSGAFAAGGAAGARDAGGVAATTGSGVMMLTAGVDAALGKSALVGLPVGIEGASVASGPVVGTGAFHDGA